MCCCPVLLAVAVLIAPRDKRWLLPSRFCEIFLWLSLLLPTFLAVLLATRPGVGFESELPSLVLLGLMLFMGDNLPGYRHKCALSCVS